MRPFTEYTIRVKAVGTTGETAETESSFQTGRLDTPWNAKWITDNCYSFPDKLSPVPLTFRKRFSAQKKVARAWVNASALGIYELELNGHKIGADYFAPGFTSYEHQIQYQTYPITHLLEKHNCIKATIAGGWAAGSFTYHRKSHISCDRQALLCEIWLEYEDGTRDVIGTDESWQVTEDTPFLLAEWYDGETYDVCFDEGTAVWKAADVTAPKGTPRLIAQYGNSVRAMGGLHRQTGAPEKGIPNRLCAAAAFRND